MPTNYTPLKLSMQLLARIFNKLLGNLGNLPLHLRPQNCSPYRLDNVLALLRTNLKQHFAQLSARFCKKCGLAILIVLLFNLVHAEEKEWTRVFHTFHPEEDFLLLKDEAFLSGRLIEIPDLQFSFGSLKLPLDKVAAIQVLGEKIEVITWDGEEFIASIGQGKIELSLLEPSKKDLNFRKKVTLDPTNIQLILFARKGKTFVKRDGLNLFFRNGNLLPIILLSDPSIKDQPLALQTPFQEKMILIPWKEILEIKPYHQNPNFCLKPKNLEEALTCGLRSLVSDERGPKKTAGLIEASGALLVPPVAIDALASLGNEKMSETGIDLAVFEEVSSALLYEETAKVDIDPVTFDVPDIGTLAENDEITDLFFGPESADLSSRELAFLDELLK